MTVLVNPGERDLIKELGDNAFEMPLLYDAQLITKRGYIPIERKHFPSDFLASVTDGRLAAQCASMRDVSQFPIIIKEGRGQFDIRDNLILNNAPSKWTKKGIRNLIRSLQLVEMCYIEETDNIKDTAERLLELQDYFDDPKHISLRARPPLDSDWLIPTYKEKYMYWLQGLPGIKISRAKLIADKYTNPTVLLSEIYGIDLKNPDACKLKNISGLGDKICQGISDLLQGPIDNVS